MTYWATRSRSGWSDLKLATPPTGDVITLAQVKAQCRIDHTDDDTLLIGLIAAAVAAVDGPRGAGISLLTQQWRLTLDRWPDDAIILPLGPVQSVDTITWLDIGYDEHTLDPSQYDYDLDADPVRIRRHFGVVWPILAYTVGVAKVTFTTGFGDDQSSIPQDIQQALLLLVSHWYEHRDAVVGVENRDSSTIMPLGVDAILDRYRPGRIA